MNLILGCLEREAVPPMESEWAPRSSISLQQAILVRIKCTKFSSPVQPMGVNHVIVTVADHGVKPRCGVVDTQGAVAWSAVLVIADVRRRMGRQLWSTNTLTQATYHCGLTTVQLLDFSHLEYSLARLCNHKTPSQMPVWR